jgi:hypothetical protein
VRLALAVVVFASLVSLIDARGSARFRNPHILSEPLAWSLHLLMLAAFVILFGALSSVLFGPRSVRRAQVAAVVIAAGCVVIAGSVGQLLFGRIWGFPLADLVWWFDILMLGQETLAFALAIALGTPGCEIGVWPELIGRLQSTRTAPVSGLACIIGLNLLDDWEEHRRERSAYHET